MRWGFLLRARVRSRYTNDGERGKSGQKVAPIYQTPTFLSVRHFYVPLHSSAGGGREGGGDVNVKNLAITRTET